MQQAFSFSTRFGVGWLHYTGEQLISTKLPSLDRPPQPLQTLASPATLETYITALKAYFDGHNTLECPEDFFDQGSPFRQSVYRAVAAIPWGHTRTYSQVAATAGSAGAARAVGTAMAQNRFAPFIPCHRVVPASGGIGRYGGGSSLKHSLLEMERHNS